MTQRDAIQKAYDLHVKWVSSADIEHGRGYDLDRIHASMLNDFRYQRTLADRKDLTREIRGELVLLGKIRKLLPSPKSSPKVGVRS